MSNPSDATDGANAIDGAAAIVGDAAATENQDETVTQGTVSQASAAVTAAGDGTGATPGGGGTTSATGTIPKTPATSTATGTPPPPPPPGAGGPMVGGGPPMGAGGIPMINPQVLAYMQTLAQYQAQLAAITGTTTAPGMQVPIMSQAGAAGPGRTGMAHAAAAPMMFPPNAPMNLTVTDSKIGVKVPTFYGDNTDGGKTTAYKFREMIERAQTLNRWTDKDTAEMAINHLAGDAADWAERMVRSNRPEERSIMESWNTMRPVFMKRFDIMPTPTQKIAKIANITQYPKETAKRYYDRLREALDYVGKETLMNPPAAGGTWEQGFLAASDVIFETFYLRGLDPKIRLQVQTQLGKDCTLEQLVDKVNEVDELLKEDNQSNAKRVMMAPLNAEPKEQASGGAESNVNSMIEKKIKEELNVMQAQLAGMGAGRGKKAATGGGPAKRPSQNIQVIPMKQRDWILCYACRQWGQHFAHECRLTKEEVRNLTRMSAKDKPTGKANDTQFGTAQGNQ